MSRDEIITPGDIEGYSDVFDACAKLVDSAANKPLAAALLLNASIAISLAVHGRAGCEDADLWSQQDQKPQPANDPIRTPARVFQRKGGD